ncbi:hypothetical protein CFP71_28255 [Amycolatopsis thailandensis]|uniref:Methyltransferase n=1 Tax=Amycolatopsis thailandensis TaxID=589330 RepID=A0A229RUX0_9PSEU|nr:SAM-dependent methyltransferase [Amycolatopsis thailandensis]OXM50325.1 hypothetical protein CFP71_28255 [Amycolatopsis thailandensis]
MNPAPRNPSPVKGPDVADVPPCTCDCAVLHTVSGRLAAQRRWTQQPQSCNCHPRTAQIENALRGGHFAAPGARRIADELTRIAPYTAQALRTRDAFTTRVVDEALAHGIDQFLDLGSGYLATNAAHAVVTSTDHVPAPRIVLVDNDDHVHTQNSTDLRHATSDVRNRTHLLHRNAFAAGHLLRYLGANEILDLTRPVCVLLVDLLHYLEPDIDPSTVVRRFSNRLAPGSWLAISVLCGYPLYSYFGNAEAHAELRETTYNWCRVQNQVLPPCPRPLPFAALKRIFTRLDLIAPRCLTTPRRWPLREDHWIPQAPFSITAVGRVPGTLSPVQEAT